MLKAKLQIVTSQLDHWENGCTGGSIANSWHWEIVGKNQFELLANICERLDCTLNDIMLNCCDEGGRIDVQLLTYSEFDTFPLTPLLLKLFKKGECEAYLTTFTFVVTEETLFRLKEV